MALPIDSKLIAQFEKHRSISKSGLQQQHAIAAEDQCFFSGDRMAYTASVNDKGRKSMIVFNKVKPYVDAVNGFMIQLRRKPQYNAVMADSVEQREFSDYLNALSDYFRQNGNFDHLESRQNKEMLIVGYGALDSNILYEDNPDGDIAGEVPRYNEVYWDPMARETNLLDSRWVFRSKKYSRDEALKRFKGSKPEDFDQVSGDNQSNYVYNPDGGAYDKISIGSGSGEDEELVEVYYYQYWELETYFRAVNPLFNLEDQGDAELLLQMMQQIKETRQEISSSEVGDDYFEFDPTQKLLSMTPKIKADIDVLFKTWGLDVDYQEHLKKVYYTAILSSTKVFMKFRSADQQGFTIKFKTGSFDEQNKTWFGLVRALKEPSKYANKALTEILYVIASNSKGGVLYEESAVADPARFEQQYAQTKAAIKVNDGAISGNQIMPKAQAALPTGYENVYQISNQSMGEVAGINREFLGTADNSQVSALMEAQRVNQVVANLADNFDSITLFQKELALLFITYMRMLAENSPGRLLRIIGDNGTAKFIELSKDRMAEEYDVVTSEAPVSATQKQETTAIMTNFADKVASFGQNIYPLVVDYLPIKDSDKVKLKEALTPPAPSPEQLKLKQAQEQQQFDLQQVLIEGQKASAAKMMAEAQAKMMSIVPNNEKAKADADKMRAETLDTLAIAKQHDLENAALYQQGFSDIRIVI